MNLQEIKGEIDFLRKCNSPYIVQYYGCVEVKENIWVLMDYCAGGAVADLLRHSPLSEGQVNDCFFFFLSQKSNET